MALFLFILSPFSVECIKILLQLVIAFRKKVWHGVGEATEKAPKNKKELIKWIR